MVIFSLLVSNMIKLLVRNSLYLYFISKECSEVFTIEVLCLYNSYRMDDRSFSLCPLGKEFVNTTENTVTSTINTPSKQDNVSQVTVV